MRSRKNQYTVSCCEVHDRAGAVLQQHVQIEDCGYKCQASVLLNILFFAVSRISSIFAACRNLAETALPVPEGALMPDDYGFDHNLSVEQYYDLLWDQDEAAQQDQPQDQGQGSGGADGAQGDTTQDGQGGLSPGEPYDGPQPEPGWGSGGSGADGQPRPWEAPPEEDGGPPEMSDYNQTMVERATAEAIDRHEREKGCGSVPGNLSRMAEGILRPKVDPFRALHAAVKYAVTAVPGRGDYTWRKIPRRYPPGSLRLPAPIQPVPMVTVIVDTSASMNEKELAEALGVIQQGLRSVPAGRIRVLSGDTSVKSAQTVFRADQVTLVGDGGTRMDRLIVQAAEERPAPDAIMLVTDGETRWPAKPVRPRVVACLTTEPSSDRYKVPDWITKVVLHD